MASPEGAVEHTYGIASNALTRFAVVMSALIHDVDHQGIPNSELIRHDPSLSGAYQNKSVAEKNSIDIAWQLLMQSQFANLRRAIYINEEEYKLFRQSIVTTVLATDIIDKDLKTLRNARWDRAFTSQERAVTASKPDDLDTINCKATIVIEHLIQASDVAHTMQHWHVYRKWNQNLFMECYQAYISGKAEKDPSINWYAGEIGFFDFYIIPLARKLKECGVFGVSSDEYLNYAQSNRMEWESRGREILAEYIQLAHQKFGTKS